MSNHVPGPWEARDVQQQWIEILGPQDSHGSCQILATVLPTQYATLGKSAEQFANAQLIAAAPLMYEGYTAIAQGQLAMYEFCMKYNIHHGIRMLNSHGLTQHIILWILSQVDTTL